MADPKLETQKRKIFGRKVKKLRKEGILPANLYGKHLKSQAIDVPLKDFKKVYTEAGETGLIDLEIDGEAHPVLIHNVQLHPVTGDPLHIDFRQVSLTEKTTAMVPIELVGESPAVEQQIGVLMQTLSEIEVEALPQDLPDRLMVDVSGLTEIDDAVTIGDIKVDSQKITLKADPEEIVAKIGPLAKEEEVAPPPAEGEGVVEGEIPAEGEEAGEAAEGEGETKPPPEETKKEE